MLAKYHDACVPMRENVRNLRAARGVRFHFLAMRDGRNLTLYSPHACVALFSRQKSLPPLRLVQQKCIPQAILGTDVICQAKSGLGKTAVFVLASLQQIEPVDGEAAILVMCHTRELAFQIKNEYARFSRYLPKIKTSVFYGGTPIQKDIEILANKETHPHVIVATPGRLNALVRDKKLRLGSIRQFILDECDKMLDQIGMHHSFTLTSLSRF